ncbi:class I SAM-dependent methyltransferase [Microbulbifer zhoushanensis]|uniref:class I SAM-dependent methyltransferase n=1 Tax=Microbulbifer zhoushanensis TaxID=2904254 RepID=UPI001F24CFEB|nr:class I SAM-dependent methyltransferase [Microbulbifer zhoushanensis]
MQEVPVGIDKIIHIGAGSGEELHCYLASDAHDILLVEPNPSMAEYLRIRTQVDSRVRVLEYAVTDENKLNKLATYNFSAVNSIYPAVDISHVLPGLRLQELFPVENKSVSDFLVDLDLGGKGNLLVIQAPGAESAIISGLMENRVLDHFSEIRLTFNRSVTYENSCNAGELLELLRGQCFDSQRITDVKPYLTQWRLRLNRTAQEVKSLKSDNHLLEKSIEEVKSVNKRLVKENREIQIRLNLLVEELKKFGDQSELTNSLESLDTEILIRLAERAHQESRYDDAIRHWQSLAGVMQESMPQVYYDRLDEAYRLQDSFPLASEEKERLSGQGDKHQLLTQIHQQLKPSLYVEVGVQTGKSLLLAECKAIGIDPMPRPNIPLQDNHHLLRMSSDDFFRLHAGQYLTQSPDLVFIDGMHLFEYVLRDFINVERYAAANTVVVIDDIFPGHAAQAERERQTRGWTGDVWKLPALLEKYRPDLTIRKVDVFPTGLLVVTGFNNIPVDNDLLLEKSEREDFSEELLKSFIKREGAMSPQSLLDSLVEEIG